MLKSERIYLYKKSIRVAAWLIVCIVGMIGIALLAIGIVMSIDNNIDAGIMLLYIFGILLILLFTLYVIKPSFSEWYYADHDYIMYKSGFRKAKIFKWSDVKKCSLLGCNYPDLLLLQTTDCNWTYDNRREFLLSKNVMVIPFNQQHYELISKYIPIQDNDNLLNNQ